MKKIKLTTKQLEIFNKYQSQKQELQSRFNSITDIENDFVITVLESANVKPVAGIKFEDGAFLVPQTKEEENSETIDAEIEVLETEKA